MIEIPCRLALTLAALLAPALPGQNPAPWQLGVFFWHESPNDRAALEGIRSALQARGRPHEFLVEQAGSDRTRARQILTGFRRRKVDLVFAMGTEAALLAKEHLQAIPVVFTAVTNPVETGVVPDWQGSGSNLAGNSNWIDPEITVRVFQLAVPDLRHLGILRSKRTGVVSAAELRGLRRHLAATRSPRSGPQAIRVTESEVGEVDEIAAAVDGLARAGVQAIWIPIDFEIYQHAAAVLAAARTHRLPIVSSSMKASRTAAIAAILPDYELLGQRAAVLALRILAGDEPPGGLPIGKLRAHRVVVNLGLARRTGYQLPLSALVLADQILEDAAAGGGKERRGGEDK